MKIIIINTEKNERLARKFPTFIIRKGTDMELGRRLIAMGYKYHKTNSGAAYRMIEITP